MITQKALENFHARKYAAIDIAAALKTAAETLSLLDKREVTALANRIVNCGSDRNAFIAKDATNFQTGELFDATGTYWNCGSKLCSNCIARFSRENRKKLRTALDAQTLKKGERYYFVTLTIPNLNLSIARSRELMNEIWSRFRKRLLCVSLIRGGAKSEEFSLTKNGIHYHHHHIWKAAYISYQEVRRNWTECAVAVFKEAKLPLHIDTKDGYLICKVLPVRDMNQLVFEVCKYITKSDSWHKLRQCDLVEAALIRRWWRMFELYGSFAPRNTSEAAEDAPNAVGDAIVHTTPLSDGSASHIDESWRAQAVRLTPAEYSDLLELEINETIRFRTEQLRLKWYFSTVIPMPVFYRDNFTPDTTSQ